MLPIFKIKPVYSIHSDGNGKTISLCPVLGKMFAITRQGLCPWILQHPIGKKIPISFIGPQPYIKYKPTIGGSEFLVIKTLAQKFRFLPDFKPERSYDVTKKNGSTTGMVWSVRKFNKSNKFVLQAK